MIFLITINNSFFFIALKCVDIKKNNSDEGDKYGFLFDEQASMKSIKLYVNDPIVITGLNEILLQK